MVSKRAKASFREYKSVIGVLKRLNVIQDSFHIDLFQDTLSTDCDASEHCTKNCCVSMVIAPIYFVVFVLMAQFVLVNVVVAVLMKHLEVSLHI